MPWKRYSHSGEGPVSFWSALRLRRDGREHLQGGLEVVGYLLGQGLRRRQVLRAFQGLVLEPDQVQVHLVAADELLVVEGPPAALGAGLAPGRLAEVPPLGPVSWSGRRRL